MLEPLSEPALSPRAAECCARILRLQQARPQLCPSVILNLQGDICMSRAKIVVTFQMRHYALSEGSNLQDMWYQELPDAPMASLSTVMRNSSFT